MQRRQTASISTSQTCWGLRELPQQTCIRTPSAGRLRRAWFSTSTWGLNYRMYLDRCDPCTSCAYPDRSGLSSWRISPSPNDRFVSGRIASATASKIRIVSVEFVGLEQGDHAGRGPFTNPGWRPVGIARPFEPVPDRHARGRVSPPRPGPMTARPAIAGECRRSPAASESRKLLLDLAGGLRGLSPSKPLIRSLI